MAFSPACFRRRAHLQAPRRGRKKRASGSKSAPTQPAIMVCKIRSTSAALAGLLLPSSATVKFGSGQRHSPDKRLPFPYKEVPKKEGETGAVVRAALTQRIFFCSGQFSGKQRPTAHTGRPAPAPKCQNRRKRLHYRQHRS